MVEDLLGRYSIPKLSNHAELMKVDRVVMEVEIHVLEVEPDLYFAAIPS